jgi:hypothetical protein
VSQEQLLSETCPAQGDGREVIWKWVEWMEQYGGRCIDHLSTAEVFQGESDVRGMHQMEESKYSS